MDRETGLGLVAVVPHDGDFNGDAINLDFCHHARDVEPGGLLFSDVRSQVLLIGPQPASDVGANVNASRLTRQQGPGGVDSFQRGVHGVVTGELQPNPL